MAVEYAKEEIATDSSLLAILNENALTIVKKELLKAEAELANRHKEIDDLQTEFGKRDSESRLISQEIDLFDFEAATAMQSLRKVYEELDREVWDELGTLAHPPAYVADICGKFMYTTFGMDTEWDVFSSEWMPEYEKVRDGMREFAPEALDQDKVAVLLVVWRNYHTILAKIKGFPKCLGALLEWIRGAVEYKLKKELYNSAKARLQENLARKNEFSAAVQRLSGVVQRLETTVSSYKADLAYSSLLPADERILFKVAVAEKYRMAEQYSLLSLGNGTSKGQIVLKSAKASPLHMVRAQTNSRPCSEMKETHGSSVMQRKKSERALVSAAPAQSKAILTPRKSLLNKQGTAKGSLLSGSKIDKSPIDGSGTHKGKGLCIELKQYASKSMKKPDDSLLLQRFTEPAAVSYLRAAKPNPSLTTAQKQHFVPSRNRFLDHEFKTNSASTESLQRPDISMRLEFAGHQQTEHGKNRGEINIRLEGSNDLPAEYCQCHIGKVFCM